VHNDERQKTVREIPAWHPAQKKHKKTSFFCAKRRELENRQKLLKK
jgi:hypothetical protein